MSKCGQRGSSRAKAREKQGLGTSLSSLSTSKAAASLNGHERRGAAQLGKASGPIAATLTMISNAGCQHSLLGLNVCLHLILAEYFCSEMLGPSEGAVASGPSVF